MTRYAHTVETSTRMSGGYTIEINRHEHHTSHPPALPPRADSVPMILFYSHNRDAHGDKAFLSNWYPAPFHDAQGRRFHNVEQFMMWHKAALFGDRDVMQQLENEPDPRKAKSLGRLVRNFDEQLWNASGRAMYIVQEGNYYKFSQNPELRHYLVGTDPCILAEAAPDDSVWGIGLHHTDPDAMRTERWRGKNLLGQALMNVRARLTYEDQGLRHSCRTCSQKDE